MRGIDYCWDSREALFRHLNAGNSEHEIDLPCHEGFRDGEWVLVTFRVGEQSLAVAGLVTDRGESLKLSFAARDWKQLLCFANSDCEQRANPTTSQTAAAVVETPPDSTVLVVDDDEHVQHLLAETLRASGFQAVGVQSGEEALDHLREHTVDLVVLDWSLPGMSGLEFCKRLRKDRALCGLPVLFLTAHSSGKDLLEAFDAGADDFVSKPFRALELSARMLGLLRRAQMPLHAAR